MTTSEIQDCAAWIKKLCIILVIKGTHLPISTCDSKYAGNATVFHMYWDGKSRVCRNCNYIKFEHAFCSMDNWLKFCEGNSNQGGVRGWVHPELCCKNVGCDKYNDF